MGIFSRKLPGLSKNLILPKRKACDLTHQSYEGLGWDLFRNLFNNLTSIERTMVNTIYYHSHDDD